MKLHSFRLKIALLSGLITGVLLLGTGVLLWRVSYEFNLDRLDREIRNLGQGNLERVLGGDHWIRLEEALKFVSGNKPSEKFVLWVENYDRVVYQSPDWPKNILPKSFPPAHHYETPEGSQKEQVLPPPPRRGEAISPLNPALPRKSAQFYTRQADGKIWRIGVMGNPYVTLILGADIDEFSARMIELRNTFLAMLPVVLLLVTAGAWVVARRALRPVTALTETAGQVTVRGLNQRIPTMTGDQEFNRLILVFNQMLDRLEESFQQATRFSADASHELKTPLARLQIELEQALESVPPGSSQQEVYSSLLEEISRLKAIIQKLLLLSLADAGHLQLNCEPVNLTRMLENLIEDCQAMAPDLSVEHDLAPNVHIEADPVLLEQALQNLVGNAVKYNCEHGRIQIELITDASQVIVRLANTGPGIPPADRDRIFQRFYRADQARNGRVDGVGLGLNLSREILQAHGGDLKLEAQNEELTVFTAWLPAVCNAH